ncbi:MAG TPA: hypothetical protein VGY54_04460, partial [Polyangiaceae bacterium]|nr:hypothetical protein [Polyangiaceae bacterium]
FGDGIVVRGDDLRVDVFVALGLVPHVEPPLNGPLAGRRKLSALRLRRVRLLVHYQRVCSMAAIRVAGAHRVALRQDGENAPPGRSGRERPRRRQD